MDLSAGVSVTTRICRTIFFRGPGDARNRASRGGRELHVAAHNPREPIYVLYLLGPVFGRDSKLKGQIIESSIAPAKNVRYVASKRLISPLHSAIQALLVPSSSHEARRLLRDRSPRCRGVQPMCRASREILLIRSVRKRAGSSVLITRLRPASSMRCIACAGEVRSRKVVV